MLKTEEGLLERLLFFFYKFILSLQREKSDLNLIYPNWKTNSIWLFYYPISFSSLERFRKNSIFMLFRESVAASEFDAKLKGLKQRNVFFEEIYTIWLGCIYRIFVRSPKH